MKKKKYRELYHKDELMEKTKKEKSTIVVEKKQENIEKEKKGFNVFFDLKETKKKLVLMNTIESIVITL